MYEKDKRSFFERLTGTINVEEEEDTQKDTVQHSTDLPKEEETEDEQDEFYEAPVTQQKVRESITDDQEVGELAVDVYEDGEDIYIQAMIAGVEPDDVDVSITRDMVTLKGRRINSSEIAGENYYHKELYWGAFSRKILLPEEVDPDKSEALEKHGLLILKLPKLNRKQSQKLEVRSID